MIGLSKDEINQLISSLDDAKYKQKYRQLLSKYTGDMEALPGHVQDTINKLNSFAADYISDILQPLIIDVIEANNDKIEKQLNTWKEI